MLIQPARKTNYSCGYVDDIKTVGRKDIRASMLATFRKTIELKDRTQPVNQQFVGCTLTKNDQDKHRHDSKTYIVTCRRKIKSHNIQKVPSWSYDIKRGHVWNQILIW